MSKAFCIILLLFPVLAIGQPCSTNNATNCNCPGGVISCDLLPDITISESALMNHLGGPDEFSQTGNGADNGRLRLSGSTPNIGFGPLAVSSEQLWVCGKDTFTVYPSTCSDGTSPQQLIKQIIYHKHGDTMSSYERSAGSMTYHPTHGHMHVDDWAIFTLRIKDSTEPDPLKWSVVGAGAKIGFCLMDYGTCSYYYGHCRDTANNILQNADFVNYGLGGGNYNCSPILQGISVGYTDIYGEHLEGMWIDIPPGTCNAEYWIVIEVDPNNNFLETNENNNWAAIPFTLTKQDTAGNPVAKISTGSYMAGNVIELCRNETILLTASAGYSYLWSDGSTTQSIEVDSTGSYFVTVHTPCGIATSDTLQVNMVTPAAPIVRGDTVCVHDRALLTAQGDGLISWYELPKGGLMLATGDTFQTPVLTGSTIFYAEQELTVPGKIFSAGPGDNTFGTGGNYNGNQHLEFYAYDDFTIESVKVYAQGAGNRTIELRNASGNKLMDTTIWIADGEQRVALGFDVQKGAIYQLGTQLNSNPALFRNNSGTAYPYILPGIVSIVTSSAGADYYYFFYDWEIRESNRLCSSNRIAVEAVVESCTGIRPSGDQNLFTLHPNPTSGTTSLSTLMTGSGRIQISLFDSKGILIWQSGFFESAGVFEYELPVGHLAPGVYYVNVLAGDTQAGAPLVVYE